MNGENPDNLGTGPNGENDVHRRLDLLERENTRLKKRLAGLGAIEDNPNFDIHAFQKAMAWYSMLMLIPLVLLVPILVTAARGWLPSTNMMVGPLPLIDPGTRGLGLGIIAMGGLACGGIAIGGGAIGIVAIGGGAIGVVALGGGAIGIFSVGGGSDELPGELVAG